jgi:hypothetical protein
MSQEVRAAPVDAARGRFFFFLAFAIEGLPLQHKIFTVHWIQF